MEESGPPQPQPQEGQGQGGEVERRIRERLGKKPPPPKEAKKSKKKKGKKAKSGFFKSFFESFKEKRDAALMRVLEFSDRFPFLMNGIGFFYWNLDDWRRTGSAFLTDFMINGAAIQSFYHHAFLFSLFLGCGYWLFVSELFDIPTDPYDDLFLEEAEAQIAMEEEREDFYDSMHSLGELIDLKNVLVTPDEASQLIPDGYEMITPFSEDE